MLTPHAQHRTITTPSEFEALAPAWDELVRRAARPSPFLVHGWLAAQWRHHHPDLQPQVEAVFDGGDLVGALPLEIVRRRGVTVARLLGHHHAALGDVVCDPRDGGRVVPQLLAAVPASGADYADLFGFAQESMLWRAARERRLPLVQRVEAPTLDLSEGWNDVYHRKTSSKKRNLHKRRRRQLGEVGNLEVTLARTEDELLNALEEAFLVHDLRWQGRPDGSGFTTEVGKRFQRAAIRTLAKQQIPRILTLRIDGRPVAFHYYLLFSRSMYVYRLAFDPALARYSPGQVATLEAIEAAAEEGATRVEFLGGDERYKMELADRQEPLFELVGLPASARGAVTAWAVRRTIQTRLALKRSERLRSLYVEGLRPVREARARMGEARGTG